MELEDKLFHSPVSNLQTGYENDLKIKMLKLERIILSKKIMCRKSLHKTNQDGIYCSRLNYNKEEYVSLAKHFNRKNEEDRDENHVILTDENAWESYPFNEISLVLSPNLLKENEKYLDGVRIPLEVQVKGDIDLKYLVAFSIPGICGIQPFFRASYDEEDAITSILQNDRYYLQLMELLNIHKKYNLSIPIVDIETGLSYYDNQEYRRKIEKIVQKS